MELGMRPRDVKKMKLWEAKAVWKYRDSHPSADDLIAGFLGYRPPGTSDRVSSIDELLAFTLFAGGVPSHG